jgi:phosphopantetheinyl transferase
LALRDDEIEIWNTDNGAPCLRVADMNGSTPSVSLTHAGGSAAACVSAPIWRIGLDYDDPARVRDPGAFLVSILSARERERLSPPKTADAATMLWCVKEAAAKTLGRGLQGRPETFEITKIAEGCGSARVAHDGTTLDMRIARIGAGFCALGFLRAS